MFISKNPKIKYSNMFLKKKPKYTYQPFNIWNVYTVRKSVLDQEHPCSPKKKKKRSYSSAHC